MKGIGYISLHIIGLFLFTLLVGHLFKGSRFTCHSGAFQHSK
jgi:hypothetical protein